MLIPDALKKVMKETHTTQKRLAEMCGLSSQGSIGDSLNIRIMANTMIKWLDKMGYEVVAQPKSGGKRREGAILIEPDYTFVQNRGSKPQRKPAEGSDEP